MTKLEGCSCSNEESARTTSACGRSAAFTPLQPIHLIAAAILLLPVLAARAHLGSPDVFYDGMVGPYQARIVVRMPTVVPGRAEISARVQTTNPVQVSFLPLTPAPRSPMRLRPIRACS